MYIGVDAGTKFLKVVRAHNNGSIETHAYCQHFGNPEKEFTRILSQDEFQDIKKIVFSGAHADVLANAWEKSETADEISAIIESLKYINNTCRFIINVGAGSIKLIELDDNGEFASYTENSLCAAGTGSFLDEQMHRMNFSYSDIASIPFIKDVPDIATRCAVFAKSDLIHRQQEGYTKEEMWSGLCKGVSATMLQSVFRGNIPEEEILFCGGLFLNPLVRMWIKETVKNAVFNDNGHFFSAIGSVILNGNNKNKAVYLKSDIENKDNLQVLETKYSKPPDFTTKKEYFSDGLEIRIHKDLPHNPRVAIGIDIGSTSTKLVAIDSESRDVLIDIYGRTKGNPVEATGKLFSELNAIADGNNFTVVSSATTGSGRKLIGKITGADAIINEITAHFKGASFFTPSIETIFEIGGQDSKYIRGQNGHVVDCNMNFVCAAGTGSFIEEQVQRLGFNVRDIGDLVMGLKMPHTSDRCTVFMEQDINKLLRLGYAREEVLAGIIRSICKNYLNRVVGSRPITGEKIFFQGATARNKALTAVFESFLQREIVVSPYCHVMGAFGAAVISLDRAGSNCRFRGLGVFDRHVELEYTKCKKCGNFCTITTAVFNNGVKESWGFMCGKETFNEAKKGNSEDHFKNISLLMNSGKVNKDTEKKVDLNPLSENPVTCFRNKRGWLRDNAGRASAYKAGIPLTLAMHNYVSLWKTFLEKLGFEVILSGKSDSRLKENGIRIAKSDFCFPIKLSLAHFEKLSESENIDFIFYPTTFSEKKQANNMPRMLCPYVIAYPSVAKETRNVSDEISKKIITPSIDFRQKEEVIIDELHNALTGFNLSRSAVSKAYRVAFEVYSMQLKERYKYGQKLLNDLKDSNKTGIVCLGRPYNLYDNVINLGLPERLKKNDVVVFPYEYMIDPDENDSQIEYMYWNYGEKILAAAEKISVMDNVYPVYFTNFSCGPDSFILTRFEEIMAGKPYLIIELDEHGSETGYLTRIEAFMDVIFEKSRKNTTAVSGTRLFNKSWKRAEKKIWFPPMFETAPRFFAAAFRAWGFDAEGLPVENDEAFELGRQNSRGSECLPATTTIGIFLQKLKEIEADPAKHALFMPTAEGPCRYGQYAILHRSILDKNGFSETEIFAPTSSNSYMGMSSALRSYLLDVVMSGDVISKVIHKIRPYEINANETDTLKEEILREIESVIEKKGNLAEHTAKAVQRLSRVPVDYTRKPLVGIVGEIYVRSNPFCNNNVIRYIEKSGGEAWLSPLSEWVIYTAWMERYFSRVGKKNIFSKLGVNIKTSYMINRLHEFENSLKKNIPDRIEPPMEEILEEGRKYVPIEFEGETILTIGRAIKFFNNGADMVVNCAPFGCMPGNITASIFHSIRKKYNKPVINLFYDGESDVNRIIGIYLSNIKKESPDSFTGPAGKLQLSLTNRS